MTVEARSATGIQSIERAFAVLRAVATAESGISEVARRVGLPVSTTARLLATLESIGAVSRSEEGGPYRIGRAISSLADASDPSVGLADRARPFLNELSERVGESAGVSVLDRGEVHYLDHVEVERDVQVRSWTGARLPLHGQSSGLILLAFSPPAVLETHIAKGLERFTSTTTTNVRALKTRLAKARDDGFVWVYGEYSEGITSIASPVVLSDGSVVGALHCYGPSYRFPGESNGPEVEAAVMTAARRLAEQL